MNHITNLSNIRGHLLLPPSSNWYCPHILDIRKDGTLCYGARNAIVLLNIHTQRILAILEGHKSRVTCLVHYHPMVIDGPNSSSYLVSASTDKQVLFWGLTTMSVVYKHTEHKNEVVALVSTFRHQLEHPSSGLIISGDKDGRIVTCTTQAATSRAKLIFFILTNVRLVPIPINCMAINPKNSRELVVAYSNGIILIMNPWTGQEIKRLVNKQMEPVITIAWSPAYSTNSKMPAFDKNRSKLEPKSLSLSDNSSKENQLLLNSSIAPSSNHQPTRSNLSGADYEMSRDHPMLELGAIAQAQVLTPVDIKEQVVTSLSTSIEPKSVEISTCGKSSVGVSLQDHSGRAQVGQDNPSEDQLNQDDPVTIEDSIELSYIVTTFKNRQLVIWERHQQAKESVNYRMAKRLSLPSSHKDHGRVWISVNWIGSDSPADSQTNKTIRLVTSGPSGELLMWYFNLSLLSNSRHSSSISPSYKIFGSGHSRSVFAIKSIDDQWMVSISMDRTMCVWDIKRRTKCWELPSLGGYIYSLDDSILNPGLVAAGIGDNTIRIWNTQEAVLHEMKLHETIGDYDAAKFSAIDNDPKSPTLLSSITSSDNKVDKVIYQSDAVADDPLLEQCHSLNTWKDDPMHPFTSNHTSIVKSLDKDILPPCPLYPTTLIWKGLSSKVTVVRWHPLDEGKIAYGTESGHIGLIDIISPTNKYMAFDKSQDSAICELQFGWQPFDSGGMKKKINTSMPMNDHDACHDESIHEEMDSSLNVIVDENQLDCLASNLDANDKLEIKANASLSLYICTVEGLIFIYDPCHPHHSPLAFNSLLDPTTLLPYLSQRTGKQLSTFPKRTSLAFDYDQQHLMVGNGDGTMELYRINLSSSIKPTISSNQSHQSTSDALTIIDASRDHQKSITRIKWNIQQGSRSWVATASEDASVYIYDFASLIDYQDPQSFQQDSKALRHHPALRHEHAICIRTTLTGHQKPILDIAWSPYQANWLVTASMDKIVQIWDVKQGIALMHLEHHRAPCLAVCWSSISPYLIFSGSEDQTLRMIHLKDELIKQGLHSSPSISIKHANKHRTSTQNVAIEPIHVANINKSTSEVREHSLKSNKTDSIPGQEPSIEIERQTLVQMPEIQGEHGSFYNSSRANSTTNVSLSISEAQASASVADIQSNTTVIESQKPKPKNEFNQSRSIPSLNLDYQSSHSFFPTLYKIESESESISNILSLLEFKSKNIISKSSHYDHDHPSNQVRISHGAESSSSRLQMPCVNLIKEKGSNFGESKGVVVNRHRPYCLISQPNANDMSSDCQQPSMQQPYPQSAFFPKLDIPVDMEESKDENICQITKIRKLDDDQMAQSFVQSSDLDLDSVQENAILPNAAICMDQIEDPSCLPSSVSSSHTTMAKDNALYMTFPQPSDANRSQGDLVNLNGNPNLPLVFSSSPLENCRHLCDQEEIFQVFGMDTDHDINSTLLSNNPISWPLVSEFWRGNIVSSLQTVIQKGLLNDQWVAWAICGGYSFWKQAALIYSSQLEAKNEFHRAAMYALSAGEFMQAIAIFQHANLYPDALALAYSRLPKYHPQIEILHTMWANYLSHHSMYIQASKSYLAIGKFDQCIAQLQLVNNLPTLECALKIVLFALKVTKEQLIADQLCAIHYQLVAKILFEYHDDERACPKSHSRSNGLPTANCLQMIQTHWPSHPHATTLLFVPLVNAYFGVNTNKCTEWKKWLKQVILSRGIDPLIDNNNPQHVELGKDEDNNMAFNPNKKMENEEEKDFSLLKSIPALSNLSSFYQNENRFIASYDQDSKIPSIGLELMQQLSEFGRDFMTLRLDQMDLNEIKIHMQTCLSLLLSDSPIVANKKDPSSSNRSDIDVANPAEIGQVLGHPTHHANTAQPYFSTSRLKEKTCVPLYSLSMIMLDIFLADYPSAMHTLQSCLDYYAERDENKAIHQILKTFFPIHCRQLYGDQMSSPLTTHVPIMHHQGPLPSPSLSSTISEFIGYQFYFDSIQAMLFKLGIHEKSKAENTTIKSLDQPISPLMQDHNENNTNLSPVSNLPQSLTHSIDENVQLVSYVKQCQRWLLNRVLHILPWIESSKVYLHSKLSRLNAKRHRLELSRMTRSAPSSLIPLAGSNQSNRKRKQKQRQSKLKDPTAIANVQPQGDEFKADSTPMDMADANPNSSCSISDDILPALPVRTMDDFSSDFGTGGLPHIHIERDIQLESLNLQIEMIEDQIQHTERQLTEPISSDPLQPSASYFEPQWFSTISYQCRCFKFLFNQLVDTCSILNIELDPELRKFHQQLQESQEWLGS